MKSRSIVCVAACTILFIGGCQQNSWKPIPDGAYRIKVEETSDQPTSMVRKYVVETTSHRRISMSEPGGANSSAIAPDGMTKERTGKAQVSVTAELQEPGKAAHITVRMTVETSGGTARSEEVLPVPGVTDLSSVLTELQPTGDLTAATTLLRLTFENNYLQITVE